MSNGDSQAMPQAHISKDTRFIESGFTKREAMAMAAMQGILANASYDAPRRTSINGMAIDAVAAADALLKELEESIRILHFYV